MSKRCGCSRQVFCDILLFIWKTVHYMLLHGNRLWKYELAWISSGQYTHVYPYEYCTSLEWIGTILCNLIPTVLELILFWHDLNIVRLVILINRWYCPDLANLCLQLRKKAVKEQKAEKRKTKIKKHVKKRKEKSQQKKKWINIILILYLKCKFLNK